MSHRHTLVNACSSNSSFLWWRSILLCTRQPYMISTSLGSQCCIKPSSLLTGCWGSTCFSSFCICLVRKTSFPRSLCNWLLLVVRHQALIHQVLPPLIQSKVAPQSPSHCHIIVSPWLKNIMWFWDSSVYISVVCLNENPPCLLLSILFAYIRGAGHCRA